MGQEGIVTEEWIAIGVMSFIVLIQVVCLIIVIIHRDYPPIKIKQVPIVAFATFSGIMWWFGSLTSLRIIPQTGFFLYCDLWGVWVQIVLGGFAWLSCLILRFWKLYLIVKLRQSVKIKKISVSFILIWLPALTYGLFSSIFKVNGPKQTETYFMCYFDSAPFYSVFVLILIYFAALLALTISLRGIQQRYLAEYKETTINLGIFSVCYSVYVILSSLSLNMLLWGRLVCAFLVISLITLTFFTIVGKPLYHLIVDKEEYEKLFLKSVENAVSASTDKSMDVKSHDTINYSLDVHETI